jgi:hypothetical protein
MAGLLISFAVGVVTGAVIYQAGFKAGRKTR